MKIKLQIVPPLESADHWHWLVTVANNEVGLGVAPDRQSAARRCTESFMTYARDMGWDRAPPDEVEISCNFFPPAQGAAYPAVGHRPPRGEPCA